MITISKYIIECNFNPVLKIWNRLGRISGWQHALLKLLIIALPASLIAECMQIIDEGKTGHMSTQFLIQSSDPALHKKAVQIAKEFAQQYIRDDVVGIVFLGAIARGYFDRSADIDISLFKKQESKIAITNKFFKIDGIEVHCWLSDYESELTTPWDMAKRWTFSRGKFIMIQRARYHSCLKKRCP